MPRRIFDTLIFDGELTLLEHRLAETADLVDFFVIVEAGETFQGQPKSMTFAGNRERFAAWGDKIRHVALPRLGGAEATSWQREQRQRDAALFALGDAAPDDIVLILDADEIASRAVLESLRRDGLTGPCRLMMTRHYEAIDLLGPRSPCCADPYAPFAFAQPRLHPGSWDALDIEWFSPGGVAVPWSAIATGAGPRRSLTALRRDAPRAVALPDAGRHLCFVDPSAHPAAKLGRFSHAELSGAAAQDLRHLARSRSYGVHHRGWWYAERPAGPLPDDLARLALRAPTLECGRRLPTMALRRPARLWAWLRTTLAPGATRAGDRLYPGLVPLWAAFGFAASASALMAPRRKTPRLSNGHGAQNADHFPFPPKTARSPSARKAKAVPKGAQC